MENLTRKTLTVSRGFQYTYYTSLPGESTTKRSDSQSSETTTTTTILLLHGWPDTAALWMGLINDFLLPHGYNVIAPDCLGYGDSSKPLDEAAYDFRAVSEDLVEILDDALGKGEGEGQESTKVVCLAHDWISECIAKPKTQPLFMSFEQGTALSSRLYNFHPDRVSALIHAAATYLAPSTHPFDLDALIAASQARSGYGALWYWKLFAADDGAQILDDHLDALWMILHAEEPEKTWLETMCRENGVREFLLQQDDKIPLPVQAYATEERKQGFIRLMRRLGGGGFAGPLRWYRSLTLGTQDNANRAAAMGPHVEVCVPFLFVGGDRDVCCRIEDVKAQLGTTGGGGGLVPDAEIEVLVGASHWCMLSHPERFGDVVVRWLKKKESRAGGIEAWQPCPCLVGV